MDLEKENEVNIQTQTETKLETETSLENLPRLEDFLKSEKEIRATTELKGLTQVQQDNLTQDKVFSRKEDEKKSFYKKRTKIVSSVYICVASLLAFFTMFNIFTLVSLNKQISDNTLTIQSEQSKIEVYEQTAPEIPNTNQEVFITLNEPRDYSEDNKELTFLDKLTILFRNIFG